LPLDRPLVMGVVNVTPDSFSDGGRFFDPKAAVAHARKLAEEGADLIDIGGESTRPGADPVSETAELDRLLPVLQGLKGFEKPISVDTRRPAVMKAALDAGASMINDVEALGAPGALQAVAGSGCAVCLMHKKGEPATMQQDPHYDNVVGEVKAFLNERVERALAAGASMINDVDALAAPGALEAVAKSGCAVCLMHKKGEPATMQRDPHYDDVIAEVKSFLKERVTSVTSSGIEIERIVVDPGFGFGKTAQHNLLLLKHLGEISDLPVLAGLSRKSTLGKLTGRPVDERLAGSLAMALLALQGGAKILRVHDVRETRDVVSVWEAFKAA